MQVAPVGVLLTWNRVANVPPPPPPPLPVRRAPPCPNGSANKHFLSTALLFLLIFLPFQISICQNCILSSDIMLHINHHNWIFQVWFLVSFLHNLDLKVSECLKKHSVCFPGSLCATAVVVPHGCSRLSALPCGGHQGCDTELATWHRTPSTQGEPVPDRSLSRAQLLWGQLDESVETARLIALLS